MNIFKKSKRNKKSSQKIPAEATEIYQPTFGQFCDNAVGYDINHAEIINGDTVNWCNWKEVKKEIHYNYVIVDGPTDYENFCKLFQITPVTLLKIIANRKTKIDIFWDFVFKTVYGRCLFISIYKIFSESDVKEKEMENDVCKIQKLRFGQHILICIPLQEEFEISNDFDEILRKITRKEKDIYPEILHLPSKIMTNFNGEISEKTNTFGILCDLNSITNPAICVTVKLPNILQENGGDENTRKNGKLSIILMIKKLTHYIKEKFPSEAVYENVDDQESLTDLEWKSIKDQLIIQSETLQTVINNGQPPIHLSSFYWNLRYCYHQFLKAIYKNPDFFCRFCWYLCEYLNKAYDHLKLTPYTKENNRWIIRFSDGNIETVKVLKNELTIYIPSSAEDTLNDLYSENNGFIWIINESSDKEFPSLKISENEFYQIGLADGPRFMEEATKDSLFISPCVCNTENEKVWMCNICKTFFHKTKENSEWLKCKCGILKINEMLKKCFYRGNVDLEENKDMLIFDIHEYHQNVINKMELSTENETINVFEKFPKDEIMNSMVVILNKDDEINLKATIFSATLFGNSSKTWKIKNVGEIFIKFTIYMLEGCSIEILSSFNVISINSKNVIHYNAKTNDHEKFLATVDYKFNPPKIGVAGDGNNIVKDTMNLLGATEIPQTNFTNRLAIVHLKGIPEVYYTFMKDNKQHLINPKSAVAELLKEATKDIENFDDPILLTIPRHFNETQTTAYLKAAKYANLKNVKFVDETISFAYGFELSDLSSEISNYIIIHSSESHLTISLIKYGIKQEKEIVTKNLEVKNIQKLQQNFFDSIILETEKESNESNPSYTRKCDEIIHAVNEIIVSNDSVIIDSIIITQNFLLFPIITDIFQQQKVCQIQDGETLILKGANIAFYSNQ